VPRVETWPNSGKPTTCLVWSIFLNETFLLRAICPEMKEGTFTHNITIVETQIVKTNVCPIISINALYAATSLLVISIDPRYYPITI